MTIALATLPGSTSELGEGSCTFSWSAGGSWVLNSNSCSNGSPVAPTTPGTTPGEIKSGTCSLIVPDDPVYIHTLLQDPNGKIDEMVEKHHSQSLSRLLCQNAAVVINRGNSCIIHNYEQTPPPRINQLVIPTGSTRWSYCLLLADDDIKERIYTACSNGSKSMNLIFGTPITGREEKEHAITLTVKVLPPRRLSPKSDDESLNNLWILPVVDERYAWQFAHTGDLSGTIAASETDYAIPNNAVDILLDQLGVTYLNVGVNDAYDDIKPSCLSKNDYENLPIVLDSILAHFGQRLAVDIGTWSTAAEKYQEVTFDNPPAGKTRFVTVDGTNSKEIYDNNLLGKIGLRACTWATATTLTTSASSAAFTVGKPYIVAGGMISSHGTTVTPHTAYASTPSSVDLQTVSNTYVNKTPGNEYKTLNVTAIWRTEFDESPSSGMQDQMGRDYFYQFFRQYDWTFAGVQPWQQGYFDDYMVYRQAWNSKTCTYDATTRVCSRQPNLTGEWAGPPVSRIEAVLQEDLDSPASSTTTPTTANVYYLKTNSDGTMTVVDGLHSVTNNDPDLAGNRGTYCRIELIGGRWKFYYVGCAAQQDLIDAMALLEA